MTVPEVAGIISSAGNTSVDAGVIFASPFCTKSKLQLCNVMQTKTVHKTCKLTHKCILVLGKIWLLLAILADKAELYD